MATPLNDMAIVFRRIFRFLRYAGFAMLALTLWFMAREVAALFRAAHAIHPVLAWILLVVVVALFVRLIGVPAWRFLKMPPVVRPPRLPDSEMEWHKGHVEARVEFLRKFLAGLERNPRLGESRERIAAARAALDEVSTEVADGDAVAARSAVMAFEREIVDPLLEPLDREADQVIRNEALGVGIATALSPNGTLDAFIVLWRNVNLVGRIANIYYGRPGARGSLAVLRDVSSAALLATYLEGLTEAAGGLLRGIVGSVAGVVAGPLIDGGVNAVATLRIGYLAKGRCRTFKAWTETTRNQALKDALVAAKDRSVEVVAGIAKAAGATVSDLPGKMGEAVKGGVNAILKKLKGEGPAAETT